MKRGRTARPVAVDEGVQVRIHRAPRHSAALHRFSEAEAVRVRERLLAWYDIHQRVLPWRRPSAAFLDSQGARGDALRTLWAASTVEHSYAVLVSEMMLQQTQVATVIDYFNRWVAEFPSLHALAKATPERVNELWAGLGYYRRARLLHACANAVVADYNGLLPRTASELAKLPGIGDYTAGAVASIAYQECTPVVDGNVVRVLTRLRAIAADAKSSKTIKLLWAVAGELVSSERPGDFNQALMELGATVCTPKQPLCSSCPVAEHCLALQEVQGRAVKEPGEGTPCALCTEEGVTESVTRYPVAEKKKAPRPQDTIVCILEHLVEGEKHFILIQRPQSGLLASFWECPSVDVTELPESTQARSDALDTFLRDAGISFTAARRKVLGTVIHVFSHIKQTMHVEHVVVDGELCLSASPARRVQSVTRASMEDVAISKGVKKCFALLDSHGEPKKRSRKVQKTADEAPQKTLDTFFRRK